MNRQNVAYLYMDLIYLFIYLFMNFAKDKLAGEISQN